MNNLKFKERGRGPAYKTLMTKWNWAFGDFYSELLLIQRSAVFNIYLINKKCQDWISHDELGQCYLDAFPYLMNEAEGCFGPEKEVINCFGLRFIHRICVPLGLLEEKKEGKSLFKDKTFYRVTPLFNKCYTDKL